MLSVRQILVSAIVLAASTAALSGCGQKGALFLPTGAAAAQRATLPQLLRPGATDAGPSVPAALPPASSPTTAASAPARP
ncbi:MAG: lipoprotein [Burkholderiaceae bacterium]|nr:lipoprotein [Burkholderiaceae bacterium]